MVFKEFFSLVENMDMSSIIEQMDSSSDEDPSSDYLSFHNLDEEGVFIIDRDEDEIRFDAHKEKMTLCFKNLKRFISSHFEISNPIFLDIFYDENAILMKRVEYLEAFQQTKKPMNEADDDAQTFIIHYLKRHYGEEFLKTLHSYEDANRALKTIFEARPDDVVYDYISPYINDKIKRIVKTVEMMENIAMNITPDMLFHHQMSIPYNSEGMENNVSYFTYSLEFMYEYHRDFFEKVLPFFENINPGSPLIKRIEDPSAYHDILYLISVLPSSYDKTEKIILDFTKRQNPTSLSTKNKHIIKASVDAAIALLKE